MSEKKIVELEIGSYKSDGFETSEGHRYNRGTYSEIMQASWNTYGKYTKDQLARTLVRYEPELDTEYVETWQKKTICRRLYEYSPRAKVAKYFPVRSGGSFQNMEPQTKSHHNKNGRSFTAFYWALAIVIFLVVVLL